MAKSILPDDVESLREWVIATIVGHIGTLFLLYFLPFGEIVNNIGFIEFDITGLCVSLTQYYVLRKYSQIALRWLFASMGSAIALSVFLHVLVSYSDNIYLAENLLSLHKIGRAIIPTLLITLVLQYSGYKRPFILILASSIAIVIVTSVYGFIISTFSFIIEPFSFFSMIIKECITGLAFGICTGLALQYIELEDAPKESE